MTAKFAMELGFVLTEGTMPDDTMDWGMALQLLNEALMNRYPFAVRLDESFFRKSAAFTAPVSGTVPLPSDCEDLKMVEVPSAALGYATEVDVREWEDRKKNTVQAGTVDTIIYRKDKATIELFPDVDLSAAQITGIFHYIRNIQEITDINQELSDPGAGIEPYIQWYLIWDVIMEYVKIWKMRKNMIGDNPSTIEQLISNYSDAMKVMDENEDPHTVYAEEVRSAK